MKNFFYITKLFAQKVLCYAYVSSFYSFNLPFSLFTPPWIQHIIWRQKGRANNLSARPLLLCDI